jgi:dTDP-glucose 4,6-dehydratase
MNIAKVQRAFGWKPKKSFEAGLGEAIGWYLANEAWCQSVLERGDNMMRIGIRA